MPTTQIIKTALECLVAAGIIIGLFNEQRIAEWERKVFRKIKRRFTK